MSAALQNLLSNLADLMGHAEKCGMDITDHVVQRIKKEINLIDTGKISHFPVKLRNGINEMMPTPTTDEIRIGESQGKIKMVKAYSTRTGRGLINSKDTVESFFANNNLHFYEHNV